MFVKFAVVAAMQRARYEAAGREGRASTPLLPGSDEASGTHGRGIPVLSSQGVLEVEH